MCSPPGFEVVFGFLFCFCFPVFILGRKGAVLFVEPSLKGYDRGNFPMGITNHPNAMPTPLTGACITMPTESLPKTEPRPDYCKVNRGLLVVGVGRLSPLRGEGLGELGYKAVHA